MSFTPITVTHTFTNLDGTAGSGVVAFKLSKRITNGTSTYLPEVPVHATLDVSGHLSQALPANNDPATLPADSTYIVTYALNGADLGDEEVSIVVPHNAPGGTVDLGSLLPQQQGA